MPHKRNPITAERLSGLARDPAGQPRGRPRGRGPVARARHLPLVGRAGRSCPTRRCSRTTSLREVRVAGRRPAGRRRADAGEPRSLARAGVLPARAAGAGGRRAEPRRRLPHRPGGRRAAVGRAASRSGRSWRSDDRVTLDGRRRSTRRSASTRALRNIGRCSTRLRPAMDAGRRDRDAGFDLPHSTRGKVRDIYDAGDGPLLMVASDRMSAFDVVMAEPVPDKGRVLTAMAAFWFEHLGDVAASHLDLDRARRTPAAAPDDAELAGRMMLVPPGRDAADRVHRAGLPRRLGVEGVPGQRDHARRAVCRPACRSPTSWPSRCSPRRPRRRAAHDENISFDDAVALVGGDGRRAGAGRSSLAVYAGGPRRAPRRRHHHRRHQVRARVRRRRAGRWPTRCSRPTRRASGRPTSGSRARRRPRFDKQPVRDWLEALGWDKRPPPPPLPRRGGRGDPGPLRRGLRADHRPLASPTGPASSARSRP